MITVELRIQGYQYSDEDRVALKRSFSSVGHHVRVDGYWAPAAGPAIELTAVLTFFGEVLAAVVVEKILNATWLRFRDAWSRFRTERKSRGKLEPELGSITIKSDDIEVQINMPIDPQTFDLTDLIGIVVDRLTQDRLRDLPIRLIALPSRMSTDDHWERINHEEYTEEADEMIWWVQGSSVNGPWEFYDANKDAWL